MRRVTLTGSSLTLDDLLAVARGGAQVDVLARSAYERYREANGQEPEIAEGLYPGDYLIPVGQALKDRFGDSLIGKPEEDWLETVREIANVDGFAQVWFAALDVE